MKNTFIKTLLFFLGFTMPFYYAYLYFGTKKHNRNSFGSQLG